MTMTNVLPAPDTELSLPALVELIHTLGISRLVLPETTENGIPAVRLCGLWRLRRTCRSDALLVEQLHLETGAWTRLSAGGEKNILRHINVCGFCSSCFADQRMMGELRNLAFSYLLDGLTDRRIVLTGTVKTVLKIEDIVALGGHTVPERRLDYQCLPDCPYTYYPYLHRRSSATFRLQLKEQRHISIPGVRDRLDLVSLLNQWPGLSLMRVRTEQKDAAVSATRLLRRCLWNIAGIRDSLRQLLSMMTDGWLGDAPFLTLSNLDLYTHRRFVLRFRFTDRSAHNRAAVLLLLAASTRISWDGSNDGLVHALGALPGMTRGALRRLRSLPASTLKKFVTAYSCMTTNDTRPQLVTLVTEPLLRNFPRSVVRHLVNDVTMMAMQSNDPVAAMTQGLFIVRAWCRWHQQLRRTVGGSRKARERWQHETNQFSHVLDWSQQTSPVLHKTRHWGSLWHAAQRWIAALNEQVEFDSSGITGNWPSVMSATSLSTVDGAEEITTAARLYQEGREMCHCVASYQDECKAGRYVVFSLSLRQQEERATLGLVRIASGWRIDQVRGPHNAPVSPAAEALSRQILQAIR